MPASMLHLLSSAVTLAMAEGLPPREVGDIVLADHSHLPIVDVQAEPPQPLMPPGVIERSFYEQERPVFGGCARTRWLARFNYGPGQDPRDAALTNVTPRAEVALPQGGTCPKGSYAGLGPEFTPETGILALKQLQRLLSPSSKARIACKDETRSGLCSSQAIVRDKLRKVQVWWIFSSQGQTTFYAGVPGQVVTVIEFNPSSPKRIRVQRQIPPPA